MDQKTWNRIVHQVLDWVNGFSEFWEGEYAVLLSEDEEDVSFQRLPNASESFWGKELPWTMIGTVTGKGSDGMEIELEYDTFSYYDQGYYNLPDPERVGVE